MFTRNHTKYCAWSPKTSLINIRRVNNHCGLYGFRMLLQNIIRAQTVPEATLLQGLTAYPLKSCNICLNNLARMKTLRGGLLE